MEEHPEVLLFVIVVRVRADKPRTVDAKSKMRNGRTNGIGTIPIYESGFSRFFFCRIFCTNRRTRTRLPTKIFFFFFFFLFFLSVCLLICVTRTSAARSVSVLGIYNPLFFFSLYFFSAVKVSSTVVNREGNNNGHIFFVSYSAGRH